MKKYEVYTHYMKPFQRDARIFVYLPKNYNESNQEYPVVYMHDGQNLFDDETASYGKSWGIVESFEKFDLPEVIIIGIECAEGLGRLDEYSPWINTTIKDQYTWIERDPGGLGDKYLDYLVNVIKPEIEQKYRVSKDINNIGIAGSSMGGLISTYAATKYSNVFTLFGCVSNAYHFAIEELKESIKLSDLSNVNKMYMDIGTEEVSGTNEEKEFYVNANKEIYNELQQKIEPSRLHFDIIEGAKHNEAAWELRFPKMIQFMFGK